MGLPEITVAKGLRAGIEKPSLLLRLRHSRELAREPSKGLWWRENPRAVPGRDLEMDLDLSPQAERTELTAKCSITVWPWNCPVAPEKLFGTARTWESWGSYKQAVTVRGTVMGHNGP